MTSPQKQKHLKPGQTISVPGLGQVGERVTANIKYTDAQIPPDEPHTWSPQGRIIRKDVFGFVWDMEQFNLALGVPTILQVIFQVRKAGGYTFGDSASIQIEVDASQAMDKVLTTFTADIDPERRTPVAASYIYGALKSNLQGKIIYVGVHFDMSTVADAEKLFFDIRYYWHQVGSYISEALFTEEQEYGPVTLKEHLIARLEAGRQQNRPAS